MGQYSRQIPLSINFNFTKSFIQHVFVKTKSIINVCMITSYEGVVLKIYEHQQ